MNTIQALIVDDEPPARDELAYLLESYPDVGVRQAQNAAEALASIRAHATDLVFLDIQMPGENGFHVLRQSLCLAEPPLFVFVTAYDRYAVRAFEDNALDYLLKPVGEQRLRVCMDRVRHQLTHRDEAALSRERLARMAESVDQTPSLERFTVEKGGRIHLVCAEDVYYCETTDRRVLVHLKDDSLPCHGQASLDELLEKINGRSFLKINRKMLVNLNHIREFAPWTGGRYCLVLDDDNATELTLSRSRVREFKNMLGL